MNYILILLPIFVFIEIGGEIVFELISLAAIKFILIRPMEK